jgi:hypothetical protein
MGGLRVVGLGIAGPGVSVLSDLLVHGRFALSSRMMRLAVMRFEQAQLRNRVLFTSSKKGGATAENQEGKSLHTSALEAIGGARCCQRESGRSRSGMLRALGYESSAPRSYAARMKARWLSYKRLLELGVALCFLAWVALVVRWVFA